MGPWVAWLAIETQERALLRPIDWQRHLANQLSRVELRRVVPARDTLHDIWRKEGQMDDS